MTLSRCWSARPLQAPAAAYEKPEWSGAPDAEKHAPKPLFCAPSLARRPAASRPVPSRCYTGLLAKPRAAVRAAPVPPSAPRSQTMPRPPPPRGIPRGLTAARTRRFPYFLEVLKNGTVIDKIDAAGKELILIGRNADSCDLVPPASSVTARAPARADARGGVR